MMDESVWIMPAKRVNMTGISNCRTPEQSEKTNRSTAVCPLIKVLSKSRCPDGHDKLDEKKSNTVPS
jgi:hypothetical protein